MIKGFISAVACAAILAAPAASFAQSGQPLTRAEVKTQLQQVEQAGYNPGRSSDANYPNDIQAAEARAAAQNGDANTSGYGNAATGTSQGGAANATTPGQ